jgi:hypothetical protein
VEEGALRSGADRLAVLMDAHLALEEARLLPALAKLPPEDHAAIAAEIRARRQPPPSPPPNG